MPPLIIRLKKEMHRKVAAAQDAIIQELFVVFPSAVFHGGTAIWRCYQGQRFSEDIDVYLPKDFSDLHRLFQRLEKKGFRVEKKKIGENSLYSTLILERTTVRLEAIFKKERSVLRDYELVEGNFIPVNTLTAELFVEEKVNAYLHRRKIRDLYDIFFLLRSIQSPSALRPSLKRLLDNFQPPLDEDELKVLMLEGSTPPWQKMLEYIRHKHG